MTRRWNEGRTVDLAGVAIAVLVAVMAAGDSEATGRLSGDALFWSLVLSVLGGVALWWRRRWPVWVAVGLAPVAAVTDVVGGAVAIAVYTVAAYRRPVVALAVAGLHAVASLPYAIARPDPTLGVPATIVLGLVVLASGLGIGLAVRGRRQRRARLRGEAARVEADAALATDRLRAHERQQIAHEMHDVLAHRISLVSLHAGALEIRPDLSSDEVARAAGTIRASAHLALEELREILGVLRGDADGLAPPPGLDELSHLVADCSAAGVEVSVEDGRPDRPLPPSVSRTAYRVVQEGLTNARKHAAAAPVCLRLSRTDAGELHLWLRNPLRPGPVAPGGRAGLIGLGERVALVGGRLDHGVRRDTDGALAFHLEAWLPWPT
jgi:signal transduction histidine kinase